MEIGLSPNGVKITQSIKKQLSVKSLTMNKIFIWSITNKQNSYKISNSKKSFLSFEEAKVYAKQNNIQTRKEYKKIQSTEENQKILPSNPDKTYSKHGWKGWADFLGKNI